MTTPQERSNLARKAAQARWSRANAVQAEEKYSSPSLSSSPDSSSPASIHKNLRSNIQNPKSRHHSWLTTRFCLSLQQDQRGDWWLLCPSGNILPASIGEVSLWLDLQTLKSPA